MKIKKYVKIKGIIFGILFFSLMSSCTKKDESTPIVLPPGTTVEYSTKDFVPFSQEFYSVELSKFNETDKAFDVIKDISPKSNLDSDQQISYTLPKDKNTGGAFIINVQLLRQAFTFESFVLPNRIAQPSLASTLTVQLLTQYKARSILSYREDTIKEIEDYAARFIEKKSKFYPQLAAVSLSAAFKFYKNGLGSDLEFLERLEDLDIKFNFNNSGVVTAPPYPFGIKNSFPVMDLANMTPNSNPIQGTEKVETIIKGQAVDPDQDLIFYSWTLQNDPFSVKIPNEFRWTPDYNGFNANPYLAALSVTDGAIVQTVNWRIQVANANRTPKVETTCPQALKEGVEVICRITAQDFDGEAISFRLNDSGVSARATLNGTRTDNVTRFVEISNLQAVDFKYTPNNNDALLRSAYFQIEVKDASDGVTLVPLAFSVEDVNKAPDIVNADPNNLNNPYVQITANTNHEWDYCASENPDDGSQTPFTFMIHARDPDNATTTLEYGFDILQQPVVTGSLACSGLGCAERITCPVPEPGQPDYRNSGPVDFYFCYQWKPSESRKTGTLNFTFKDNHGGSSPLRPIILTANDRNQKPCVRSIENPGQQTLSLTNLSTVYAITADDFDGQSPFISITSSQNSSKSDVYPFLLDSATNQIPLFRQKTVNNTLDQSFYRRGEKNYDVLGGSKMTLLVSYESPTSGVVRFFRPTGYTNDITIPANYVIETNPVLSPYLRFKYKTVMPAVMEKDDIELWVPVSIYDQSVSAGTINNIKSSTLNGIAVSSAGLTITNPASIDESGMVTITRSNTAAALVLPKLMEFFSGNETNSGVSSVRYYNYAAVEFAIGQANATVNVTRLKNHIYHSTAGANALNRLSNFVPFIDYNVSSNMMTPQNLMTTPNPLTDTTIQVAYENLYNYINFSLNPINAGVSRTITATAEDTYKLSAGATLKDQNGLTYTTSVDVNLFGVVTLTRASTANGLTLTKAATEFRSENGSRYSLATDVTFAPGAATASATIGRTNHTNPTSRTEVSGGTTTTTTGIGNMTFTFTDTNFKPVFISPPGMILNLDEGQKISDFLLEVNDNPSNPGVPRDPFDRHSFSIIRQGAEPVGAIRWCREKGNSLDDIDSPVGCTPCSTILPDDYWDSARCYARFFPDQSKNTTNSDIDRSYTYVVTANDNGTLINGEVHTNRQTLTVKVNETNDPPVFTDENWIPITTATPVQAATTPVVVLASQGTPNTCGSVSCGDFVESNYLEFSIFASDPDRNPSNKSLVFSLENQVFDLETNQWITRPSTITISTDAAISNSVFPGNWGSRFQGRIGWSPNDEQAKKLAGAGFIIKVKVTDHAVAPNTPLFTFAFYKVTVKNINSPPSLKNPINLTLTTDRYFDNPNAVVLADKDFYSINDFQPFLGLCNSDSTSECSSPTDGWPSDIKTYISGYSRNAAVPECRGGAANGPLNQNFALPYLYKAANSPYINASNLTIESVYGIKWCPQRGHIGLHNAYLSVSDNGDKDRTNAAALPRQKLNVPIIFNVVAPIFFQSPFNENINGNLVTVNHPTQAFVGKPFTYRALTLNTRKNNVTYTLLQAPAGMTLDNGATSKVDSGSGTGVGLKWTPAANQFVATSVPLSTHTIRLSVRDNRMNPIEEDILHFNMVVKSSTIPFQLQPVMTSISPSSDQPTIPEKEPSPFTIFVNDPNLDSLTYSWFLDNVKVFDQSKISDGNGDSLSTFIYKPTINEFGKHTIRVEITDGLKTIQNTWKVTVANTVPNITDAGNPEFNIVNYNLTKLNKTVTNLNWTTEVKVENLSNNSIVFSGSYNKAGTYSNFLYNLKLKDGVVTPALASGANGNPLIAESLPWQAGLVTKRLSFASTGGSSFRIIASPVEDRNGSFTSDTTQAICLPQTLTLSSSAFNPSHQCQNDATQLYKNESSYGNLPAALFKKNGNKFDITISQFYDSISWSDVGSPKAFYFAKDTTIVGHEMDNPVPSSNGLVFSGVGVSSRNNRIYAVVRDIANKINQLLIFDATPMLSGNNPTLITTLNISDGLNPLENTDHQASDVLVINDAGIDEVFILLPGKGGLAVLPDSNNLPVQGDLQYIGNTGQIGASNSDGVNRGRKLVYNSGSKLVYGLSRDSNQIFSVNPGSNIVNVQPITVRLDSILTFNNDASTFGVSRTLGQIFRIK